MKFRKQSKAKPSNNVAKRNKVLVNFILDKSGSMSGVQKETIEGFNKYIEELKAEKNVEYLFSLTLFDTAFNAVHTAVPIENVKALDTSSYIPDGSTALYDATGKTIRAVEKAALKVDKVVTVIYTDGHENSSHEWTFHQIQDLIKEKEALGNWTVVYLGATMDAVAIGQNLGTSPLNSYQYTPASTPAVFATMAVSTNSFSRGVRGQTACLVSPSDLGSGITGDADPGNVPSVTSGPLSSFVPPTTTQKKTWKERIESAKK